jgi:hypothetical protein
MHGDEEEQTITEVFLYEFYYALGQIQDGDMALNLYWVERPSFSVDLQFVPQADNAHPTKHVKITPNHEQLCTSPKTPHFPS